MIAEVEIKNADKVSEKYIVARECDSELWFWGEYENKQKAEITAKQIGGIVVENPNKKS